MAVQCLKVGLEVPYGDQTFKRTDGAACSETEVESERIELRDINCNNHLLQMEVEKEVPNCASIPLSSCQKPVAGSELGSDDGPASTFSSEEISIKGKLNGSLFLDSGDSRSLPNGTVHRPLVTPTVVHVLRPMEVENKGKDLPIVMMEQEIMEAVNEIQPLLSVEKLDVVKPLKFLSSSMKQVLVQTCLHIEEVLLVSLNHDVLLSLPLQDL